jgi:hypothetical protein
VADKPTYSEPSEVDAEEGVVLVRGPDDVDVNLSAEAADETSDRLLTASMKARGQRIQEKKRRGIQG